MFSPHLPFFFCFQNNSLCKCKVCHLWNLKPVQRGSYVRLPTLAGCNPAPCDSRGETGRLLGLWSAVPNTCQRWRYKSRTCDDGLYSDLRALEGAVMVLEQAYGAEKFWSLFWKLALSRGVCVPLSSTSRFFTQICTVLYKWMLVTIGTWHKKHISVQKFTQFWRKACWLTKYKVSKRESNVVGTLCFKNQHQFLHLDTMCRRIFSGRFAASVFGEWM